MKFNINYQDESGNYAPKVLVADGLQIINPTRAMYESAGYHYVEQVPSEPTEEEVAEMQRQARIKELHELLEGTDYKVIKNSECQMLGLPIPYDPQEVHDEKQAWRDELNALEAQ
jgi:hypothetical protein